MIAVGVAAGAAVSDADQAVTTMYGTHYAVLVRLAALLVGDVRAAEEIVQDSFVAMHGAWHRLRRDGAALSYLRRSVISRTRLIAAPPAAAGTLAQAPAKAGPPEPTAIGAIRALPHRQREVLVLMLYLNLPDRQIASATGLSLKGVRDHAARALAALRDVL